MKRVKREIIALCLMFLVLSSVLSSDFAHGNLNDPKHMEVNIIQTGDNPDDILPVDTFSHTSQLVYSISRSKEMYDTSITGGMNNFNDVCSYFTTFNVNNYAVNITGRTPINELNNGDIIKVDDMPNSFYIYRGIDVKGLYAIEDLNHKYVTTSDTLMHHFTGYAILFRPRNPRPVYPLNHIDVLSRTERSGIVDIAHDINARDEPFTDAGQSAYMVDLQSYEHEENNAAIRNKAREIVGTASTPIEKARRVFNWVNHNIAYRFYYNSKNYAAGTLRNGYGNCCDQSRLVIALLRSVGLGAGTDNEGDVYFCNADVKLQSGKNIGHVWPAGIFSGIRTPFDTTTGGSDFGHNSFTVVSTLKRSVYLSF